MSASINAFFDTFRPRNTTPAAWQPSGASPLVPSGTDTIESSNELMGSTNQEVPPNLMASNEPQVEQFVGLPFNFQESQSRSNTDLPSIEPEPSLNEDVPRLHISEIQYPSNKEIGRGTFGVVHKAIHFQYGTIVVKFENSDGLIMSSLSSFEKSPPRRAEKQRREFNSCYKLNHHPNIVALYGYIYDTDENTPIGYAMEYMPGGDLYKAIQKCQYPEIRLNTWTKQIAIGLSFMHSRRIIHRDLKPNNVLLSYGGLTAKLADFGQSKYVPAGSNHNHTVGQANIIWSAPEIFMDNFYTFQVDVWSYAMVVYYIYYKKNPYEPEFMKKMSKYIAVKRLLGDDKEAPLRPQLEGKPIDKVIEACWKSKAEERVSMDSVVQYFYSVEGRQQFQFYEL